MSGDGPTYSGNLACIARRSSDPAAWPLLGTVSRVPQKRAAMTGTALSCGQRGPRAVDARAIVDSSIPKGAAAPGGAIGLSCLGQNVLASLNASSPRPLVASDDLSRVQCVGTQLGADRGARCRVVQRQSSDFYCVHGDLVVVRVLADWRARTAIL